MSAASFVYTNSGQVILTEWTKLYTQIVDIRNSMVFTEGEDLDRLLQKQVYLGRIIARIEEEAKVPKELRT
jgi:hypothetical protein